MDEQQQLDNLAREKLNLETGEVSWRELERHFASGRLISVDANLDLVDVAFQFEKDNKLQLEQWLTSGEVQPVSDDQAHDWHADQAVLWAVVVKPWVLVQVRIESNDSGSKQGRKLDS
jgi:hypothetical protein